MRRVWILVLALTLLHSLIWWRMTPAWAAPDEPGHYLTARLLAALASDSVAAIERDIIASLARADWWGYNGRPLPQPMIGRFADDPALAASGAQAETEPALFYVLPALALRLGSPAWQNDPALALRWLRLWSVALRIIAVLAALVLARRAWPTRPDRALSLGLLVGLLPMVGFIGGSFNNDALALAWGAWTFTLLALPASGWLTLPVLLVGPLLVKASLFAYWPTALVTRRWGRIVLLIAAVCAIVLLVPNPQWAAGWRRAPEWTPTRANAGLLLRPDPGNSAQMAQVIGGKETLRLRNQPLQLRADVHGDADAVLTLHLRDDDHTVQLDCPASPAPCEMTFTPGPRASFLYLTASAADPVTFRLRLLDHAGRDQLINGDGRQPDLLGSPLWRSLERRLPVPAGFFAQAISPAASDAAAQLRYLLFAGFTWASFWGWFGWLSRPLPWPVYGLLVVFTLLVGWGVVKRTLTAVRRWRAGQAEWEDRLIGLSVLTVVVFLAQTFLPMLGQSWQPQGRYLFPALLPISALIVFGVEYALPVRWRPRAPALLFVALVAFNFVALVVVAR